jgi:CO/xanthine dehydrogenase Mo-binding subunit
MQAAVLEVDPETFEVTVLRFAMVHDCGTVINPLIVEGQVQGGIAQGIGNAFYEKLDYDDEGQLRNASLADYLIPGPGDVPDVELDHTVTPSPLNPLGIKGVGEAGAIPVGALFARAIENAMQWPDGYRRIDEIPLSPDRLWAIAGGASGD